MTEKLKSNFKGGIQKDAIYVCTQNFEASVNSRKAVRNRILHLYSQIRINPQIVIHLPSNITTEEIKQPLSENLVTDRTIHFQKKDKDGKIVKMTFFPKHFSSVKFNFGVKNFNINCNVVKHKTVELSHALNNYNIQICT